MIYRKLLLTLAGISILALYSCNDNPTSVGSNLLKNDFINVNQIDSYKDSLKQTSSYYKKTVALGASSTLLLGKNANVQASALLRFLIYFDDSVKTDYTNNKVSIVSASVKLTPTYTFGDSTANFNFSVHKVSSNWTSEGFDSDSLSSLVYDPSNLSSNLVLTDSSTSFNLDLSLVNNWMKEIIDSTFADDNGIYLLPTSDTKKVIGYTALSATYTSATSLTIVLQKTGVYTDTLTFYPAQDVSAISSTAPAGSAEDIFVQGGIVYNSKLWFDVSSVPKNAIINRAELTLTVDSTATITGSSFVNSLYVYFLEDTANEVIDSIRAYSLSRVNNTFDGNITSYVQSWVDNVSNDGLLLKVANPTSGLELFALKGSNAADRSVRPRLIITYTAKK